MNAEATIGDILAAALRDEQARIDALYRAEIDRWAMVTAASHLSVLIADHARIGANEAFDALTYVPDDCLPLLQTPEGWTALAHIVSADLQVSLTGTVRPTIH